MPIRPDQTVSKLPKSFADHRRDETPRPFVQISFRSATRPPLKLVIESIESTDGSSARPRLFETRPVGSGTFIVSVLRIHLLLLCPSTLIPRDDESVSSEHVHGRRKPGSGHGWDQISPGAELGDRQLIPRILLRPEEGARVVRIDADH